MLEIKIIDEALMEDINLPNEPFALTGTVIPAYADGRWSYRVSVLPESERTEMCFPEAGYDYESMKHNTVFLGAYEQGVCVGLAVLQDAWFRYMYLSDLKVARAFRRRGVATALLEKAKAVCLSRNYGGIYTCGQDNNPGACLFYLNSGFRIGGLDTEVYRGTGQAGKSDIFFYLDCSTDPAEEQEASV